MEIRLLRSTEQAAPVSLGLIWKHQEGESHACLPAAQLQEWLIHWARNLSPGCRILSTDKRPDRTHSLSGGYLRMHGRAMKRDFVLLASCRESMIGENHQAALSQALLWLSFLKRKKRLLARPRIHILVPPEYTGILRHRAGLLDQCKTDIAVWQMEAAVTSGLSVRHAPLPNPPMENREFRWPVLGPFHWNPDLARVLDLAPGYIKRYPRFREYDSLRLWGLEFAIAKGDSRECISFGVGSDKAELSDDNFEGLRALVEGILYYRRSDSPDPYHPYYRLQAERWLESLILEDIPKLFPELVPASVYPQIPVYLDKDPGRVDILGADEEGTLVILELKVTPDPDLPLQALDYWGRVVRHNSDGDFIRRGYFSGMSLNRARPRIYLVAPVFSFHDSTERLVSYFDRDVEVWKIAINEDWRSGVKILRRTRLECGEG
jgi:hypothetical protein